MEQTNSKIWAALSKAQAVCKLAEKSGKNTYDHYDYAMLPDYITVVQKPMADNGLSLSVTIEEIVRLPERATASGKKEQVVQVKIIGHLIHESGETADYVCYGEGQDRSDKALYKAITGAKKYLIANIFNLATSDDVEKDSDHERDGMDQRAPADRRPAQTAASRPPSQPTTRLTSAPSQAAPVAAKTPEQLAAWAKNGKVGVPVDERPLPLEEGLTVPTTADVNTGLKKISVAKAKVLCGILAANKVDPGTWKKYLQNTHGWGDVKNITEAAYQGIFDTITKHPEQITSLREPGQD
jgi:ERF superfamily